MERNTSVYSFTLLALVVPIAAVRTVGGSSVISKQTRDFLSVVYRTESCKVQKRFIVSLYAPNHYLRIFKQICLYAYHNIYFNDLLYTDVAAKKQTSAG